MKIILCTSPSKETDFRWPPIGLLYIASYLKSKGDHEIQVIDGFSGRINDEQFLSQIVSDKPDVIGLSCTSYTFLKSVELLEKIKQELPNTIIVLGGIHVTFYATAVVKGYKFVDFVVKGEGEVVFSELVENLHDREKLRNISGLTFIDNDGVIDNKAEVIADIDSLPFPDRSLLEDIDYGHYWFGFKLNWGKFTTILTSRSCPYKCIFCCCSTVFGRKWRARSVDNILDELEEIYSQGYGSCIFVDDNFTLIPDRVVELCRGIVKRKIKMDLHCEGRIDKTSLGLLREMRKAGFSTIYFGMESGQQKVLDYYKKGITIEQIKAAVKNAKKAGMNAIGSFIIGAPIETRDDLMKTIEFATDLRIGLQINDLNLVPGTEMWARLENEGKLEEDDWKRAHSVCEYYGDISEEELKGYMNYGYDLLIKKLRRPESFRDISPLLSRSNFKIALWNLTRNFSPLVQHLIRIRKEGFQPFEEFK